MPLSHVKIENYKSIKQCLISLNEISLLIGENGAGKTNILEAIEYFYSNLVADCPKENVFDLNNHFSNQVKITLYFDLSEFVIISKAQTDAILEDLTDEEGSQNRYSGYYKKIITLASSSPNKIIAVELSQIKGQKIKWNYSYEDRLIFKSLFPLFYVNTRNLDLEKWEYIWDAIGELGKVSNAERKEIEKKFAQLLTVDSKEMPHKIKEIDAIFNAANVGIKTATSKEFASSLIKSYLSGEIINQGGKKLDYYSTGTNSVKYIELLLRTIDAISRTKLKEPVVLIDEPEISLHPRLVDELTDAIVNANNKNRILISTHSARLTKNLIINGTDVALYDVRLRNKYSFAYRMKLFPQYSPTSKARVTDDHVNSYFSRAILFVEGATELELFSHPVFVELFPEVRLLDVYQAMSEKPILNIMNPRKTNSSIPFICLIDMDKAVAYEPTTKRYRLKNEYFTTNSKEIFQYKSKQQSGAYLHHQRKRITAMTQGLHIHYFKPFWSTNDPNHMKFQDAVHEYLLDYNVFTFSTTIEGALVNENTYEYALRFLKTHKQRQEYEKFEEYISGLHKTDRCNFIRIVFNGKSDLWQTSKSIQKNLSEEEKRLYDTMKIGEKTSGWVTEFLEGYFAEMIGKPKFLIKEFRRFIEDPARREAVLLAFQKSFPELGELFMRICDMIT